MIQRIQTLLLLLAAITSGLLFWEQMALCSVHKAGLENLIENSPLSDGLYEAGDSPISAGLLVGVLLLNILAIVLFKHRSKQILFTRIALGLMVVFTLFMGGWFYMNYTSLPEGCEINPAPGIILPFLTIVFLFMAIKRIVADENLVRSMDRLR